MVPGGCRRQSALHIPSKYSPWMGKRQINGAALAAPVRQGVPKFGTPDKEYSPGWLCRISAQIVGSIPIPGFPARGNVNAAIHALHVYRSGRAEFRHAP